MLHLASAAIKSLSVGAASAANKAEMWIERIKRTYQSISQSWLILSALKDLLQVNKFTLRLNYPFLLIQFLT
jgi:hypothetical protein